MLLDGKEKAFGTPRSPPSLLSEGSCWTIDPSSAWALFSCPMPLLLLTLTELDFNDNQLAMVSTNLTQKFPKAIACPQQKGWVLMLFLGAQKGMTHTPFVPAYPLL